MAAMTTTMTGPRSSTPAASMRAAPMQGGMQVATQVAPMLAATQVATAAERRREARGALCYMALR